VIGCGGIASTEDARQFLAAGAVAVQIGAALLIDPGTAARIGTALLADG
jgi:dihydroorotate dehydrogenase (NAD+) catalytic subunit